MEFKLNVEKIHRDIDALIKDLKSFKVYPCIPQCRISLRLTCKELGKEFTSTWVKLDTKDVSCVLPVHILLLRDLCQHQLEVGLKTEYDLQNKEFPETLECEFKTHLQVAPDNEHTEGIRKDILRILTAKTPEGKPREISDLQPLDGFDNDLQAWAYPWRPEPPVEIIEDFVGGGVL